MDTSSQSSQLSTSVGGGATGNTARTITSSSSKDTLTDQVVLEYYLKSKGMERLNESQRMEAMEGPGVMEQVIVEDATLGGAAADDPVSSVFSAIRGNSGIMRQIYSFLPSLDRRSIQMGRGVDKAFHEDKDRGRIKQVVLSLGRRGL
jgi:hypothetical protein